MNSAAPTVVFAVLGDVHGAFDRAITLLAQAELEAGVAISFVLQVGDLEAHRNREDLKGMYAPHRRKNLGDYPGYESGQKRFPWPMYFIGGNHEPYQSLARHSAGGVLAENIHYLGRAGRAEIQGLSVTYLTGIFDERYYHRPASERGPVSGDRDWEMQRFLSCFVEEEINSLYALPSTRALLVHPWPLGLVRIDDHEPGEPKHRKLRFGETGVAVLNQLIQRCNPEVVFCGHLHRRYTGTINGALVHCLGQVGGSEPAVILMQMQGLALRELPY